MIRAVRSGDNNQLHSRLQQNMMQPEKLPYVPFDSVANHGISHLAGNNQTKPTPLRGVYPDVTNIKAPPYFFAPGKHLIILMPCCQASGAWE
jgi:hypothetical protein